MEDTKRIKLTRTTQLEDIPDGLIQHIQSLLPVKEAARTSVLSKSWLQAWSNNPTLRFRQYQPFPGKQQKRYMHMIDRTIQRYFRDNIAITSFKLHIVIDDDELASFVNKWIRKVVSKSCLTEIYLKLEIFNHSFQFQLPGEIFSGKNLEKVSLRIIANNPWSWTPITDTFASVRELCLEIYDDNFRFHELLKFKFPFLESLTLQLRWYGVENILDITSVYLKRLIIKTTFERPLRVQVVAPKLLFFSYTCGKAIPSLSFATHVPDQIQLNFKFMRPVDVCFFLGLTEILKLSTKFNIKITTRYDIPKQFIIDIDDLRRQVPATKIQQFPFETLAGEDLRGTSEFFYSFFTICKPSNIKAIRSIVRPTSKILKKRLVSCKLI